MKTSVGLGLVVDDFGLVLVGRLTLHFVVIVPLCVVRVCVVVMAGDVLCRV